MNIDETKKYVDCIKNGISEESIIKKFEISIEELYGDIAYVNEHFARTSLKHFCRGCANDLCFCWPMRRDEPFCPVHGYEPHCPLKK